MSIGPDGKLYVGVGAYDPSLAQHPDELPGKLLRLNLDGTVPDDNPAPGSYVFLTGVRNTQGYDWFDDNHLLLMDHGPTAIDPGVPEKGWDEFNVARAGENEQSTFAVWMVVTRCCASRARRVSKLGGAANHVPLRAMVTTAPCATHDEPNP